MFFFIYCLLTNALPDLNHTTRLPDSYPGPRLQKEENSITNFTPIIRSTSWLDVDQHVGVACNEIIRNNWW